jgi:hypothetical protein
MAKKFCNIGPSSDMIRSINGQFQNKKNGYLTASHLKLIMVGIIGLSLALRKRNRTSTSIAH